MGWDSLESNSKKSETRTNEGVISAAASRVAVRVIPTDEEWMIANMVCGVLGLSIGQEQDRENKTCV